MRSFNQSITYTIIFLIINIFFIVPPCLSDINNELAQIEQQHTSMMIPTLLQLNEQLLYTIRQIQEDFKSEVFWEQFNIVIQKVENHLNYTKRMKNFFSGEQKEKFLKIEETLSGLKTFQRYWIRGTKAMDPEKAKLHYQQAVITVLTIPLEVVNEKKVLKDQVRALVPIQKTKDPPSAKQPTPKIETIHLHPLDYDESATLSPVPDINQEKQIIKEAEIVYENKKKNNRKAIAHHIDINQAPLESIQNIKPNRVEGFLTEGTHYLKQYNYQSALRYFDNLHENRNRFNPHEKDLLREYIRLTQNVLSANEQINRAYFEDSNCKQVSQSTNKLITNSDALKISENSLLSPKIYLYHMKYLHYMNWLKFGDCRRRERKFKDAIENYRRSIEYITSNEIKDNIKEKIEGTKQLRVNLNEAYELLNKYNYKEAWKKFKSVDDDYENLTKTLLQIKNQGDIDISYEIKVLQNKYGHIFDKSQAKSHKRHLRFIQKLNKAKQFYQSGNTKKATSLLETAEFLSETSGEKEQVQQLLEKFQQ